jgi:hypothetical protein
MTKARRDGLVLLFLGASILVLLMVYLVSATTTAAFEDFKPDYYASRCLIEHGDPYNERDVLRVYRAEGGERPHEAEMDREIATRYVYPPTAFSIMIPFAWLPWGPAHLLWMILGAGGLVFASVLAWDLGADHAPILSGALCGFVLANSLVITVLSNPSEIAIALCIVAVWCFMRDRYVPAGIVCLAISLAMKPQDAGMVWLFFLLAGSVYRRRAIQTLFATIAIALPGVLWTWCVAPHWFNELRANIQAFSLHGGLNDPGPASRVAHTLIDLQVVLSLFKDDPRFYNPASYLVFAVLAAIWGFVTLRSGFSPARAWMGIAAIVTLSLLPVHHHLYDTKLLLLLAPAMAVLSAEKGPIKWPALLVTLAALAATGDISGTIFFQLVDRLLPPATGLAGALRGVLVFPVPLILLAVGVFYLWVYARWASRSSSTVAMHPGRSNT